MAKPPLPSHATFYVAHAVANDVLIKLGLSLASHLAITTAADREKEGDQLTRDAIEAFSYAADYKPQRIARLLPGLGPYDADEAESLAMEIVGDALNLIRKATVG